MSVQCCGQLLIRPMHFAKAGQKREGHTHTFDHITAIWTGGLRVIIRKPPPDPNNPKALGDVISDEEHCAPDMKGKYSRPCLINIKANLWHELIALRDDTCAGCLYFHRDPDSKEVVPEFNGWMGAAK